MDQVVWLTTMKSGNLDEVKALIDAARETNERLVFMGGSTPLHWAAESGSIGCVKLLLDSKLCQLDEKDASGATPLHWASGEGHVEIVQLLHKNGCELDVLDANNETPLHYACLSGRLQCCQYLVENRAKINMLNNQAQTPLHLATLNRFIELISYLIDSKADVNLKDQNDPNAKSAYELALSTKDDLILANFNPKEKRFFDQVRELELTLQTVKRERDEAAATAEANAVKLRDLFRSFNDLEVINHDTRSKIQSLNEALSEQKQINADLTTRLAELEKQQQQQQQQSSSSNATAIPSVSSSSTSSSISNLNSYLAKIANASSSTAAAASSTYEDVAKSIGCSRCTGLGADSARPVTDVDLTVMHETLQQLNVLLGLTTNAVGDCQRQVSLVTARIDRNNNGRTTLFE